MILERAIQKLARDREEDYKAFEKKWADLEARLGGFPTKSHYSMLSGTLPMGTMIWQREWKDFTTMEAAYNRAFADPEAAKLSGSGIILEETREFYFVEEY